jgi:serine/threonine protein kinase
MSTARDAGKIGSQPTALSGRGWAASVADGSAGSPRVSKQCPTCLERYPLDFRVCPRDASELQEVVEEEADLLIGTTVGETFSIVRAIGEGGMARVYEARHVRLAGRRFAVKVLHPMYAQQPMVVARFQREAEAASGIAHPNVVDVFDIGTTPDGRPFLVSEFLEGKDFATYLDEHEKIQAAPAVHVVRQVCRALSAAHAKGVVHRDVKPENVFLVGDPEAPVVKVLDFGISKIDTGGASNLTHTGMIMGTPGYMPPEQAKGTKVDHRADIYGVDSDDAGEALSMVIQHEPPRPRSHDATIPEALELVIQRAMAKEPDDRYSSMAELDEQLAAFEPEATRSLSLLPPPVAPVTGKQHGKTTIAATKRSPSISIADVDRATREAKLARPTLLFISFVIYVWVVGCFVDIGSASLAFLRNEQGPTPTEKMIVSIIVVTISLTPLVFWIRHLGSVWGNSVRSVELAGVLRHVVLSATIPYAFLALALRVFAPLADPRWAPFIPAASLAFVFFGYTTGRLGSRRRSTW